MSMSKNELILGVGGTGCRTRLCDDSGPRADMVALDAAKVKVLEARVAGVS
jgi:hypothetical protein